MPTQIDYYQLLEVSRTASGEEIKRSFRRLALRYHPDRNPDDPEAELRFKEINAAYEVLKDPQKRAAYDRYGASAFQNGGAGAGSGFGGFGGGGFGGGFNANDLGDLFEQMFGNARQERRRSGGQNIQTQVEITLAEAFTGVKKEVTIETRKPCETCHGSGSSDPKGGRSVCPTCRGRGAVRAQQGFFLVERPCPTCHGEGETVSNPCESCRGSGTEPTFENVTVEIPAGVEDGTRLRLHGKGAAGPGKQEAGDLYVLVTVEPSDLFQREGATLYCRIPLRMTQAALGAEIEVPVIDGTKTRLKIPAGTQSGQSFRLKGKGFSVVHARARGDMHVQVSVETPTRLGKRQRELLEEFEKEGGDHAESSPQNSGFFSRVREFFDGQG
ncbi:molecular chaperone DnaJ [Oecophyllibacter saccharovorans]|uniref:molecular chaperone DnaJ n=1 Tax=Oecophyllibacter saccharovorans TaxID=2558360 RepID=UPI0011702756|nr:molecular chaperone DnaJ [Oecophyllibacter saccharovorans]TPW35119.1 molecular chaperone DnaJ [Oecophyllibacter saccharovorans]